MRQDMGTSRSGSQPVAAVGWADAPPGRPSAELGTGDLASAMREHKAAFARALAQQDEDFRRFCDDRLEQIRSTLAALGACGSWAELIELQDDWARVESQACLIEARCLILLAGLIRDPEWLTRQVRARGGSRPWGAS